MSDDVKDIPDMVLDFYAAKSLAEALRESSGTDDQYRAGTEELRAESLLRDITFEWERLRATARAGLEDRERLDWLEKHVMSLDLLDDDGQFVGTFYSHGDPIAIRDAIDKARNDWTKRSGLGASDG